MDMTTLRFDRFEFRINKVVPSSDPSVINLRVYENGIYSFTISMLNEEALLLVHTLITYILEPEE